MIVGLCVSAIALIAGPPTEIHQSEAPASKTGPRKF